MSDTWEDAIARLMDALPPNTFAFGSPIAKCERIDIWRNDDGHIELSPRADLETAARADERLVVAKLFEGAVNEARAHERAKVLVELQAYLDEVDPAGLQFQSGQEALIAKLRGGQ